MATTTTTRPITRYFTATVRVLLGLLFATTGLNGFLMFAPGDPSALSAEALAFTVGLAEGGFMNPLVSGIQLVAGVLLVVNRFVPLALTGLAPIVVGIVGFHVFLAPSGLPLAIIVAAIEVYLAWTLRARFAPMLRP